jgi:hypothetical protein
MTVYLTYVAHQSCSSGLRLCEETQSKTPDGPFSTKLQSENASSCRKRQWSDVIPERFTFYNRIHHCFKRLAALQQDALGEM